MGGGGDTSVYAVAEALEFAFQDIRRCALLLPGLLNDAFTDALRPEGNVTRKRR